MKRSVVGAVTIALVAWAVAVAIVAEHAPGRADDATSAAVNAIYGGDPPAGIGATCGYAPDAGMVLLRARYRCELGSCFEVTDRLYLTDHARGEWSYEVIEGGLAGVSNSGDTGPVRSAGSTLDREGCRTEARGLLQHQLEEYVGNVLAGSGGESLRRALPGLSVREIAHARFKVVDLDLDAREARVRVSVGRERRTLEARLVGDEWLIR